MSAALCEAETCRPADYGGPRRAEPGRPLCGTCSDRFGENLRRIAQTWPDLESRLSVEGRKGEKVTGTKTPGLVINEQVSDLMADIRSWLWWLVRTVLSEHEHARLPEKRDPATLAAWLGKWHAYRLTYNADHGLAVAVVDDASRYRSDIRSLAYPSSARRVDIPGGRCTVSTDQGECPGMLYAIVRDDASLLPSEIVCNHDETHRVSSGQWVSYARRLRASGRI